MAECVYIKWEYRKCKVNRNNLGLLFLYSFIKQSLLSACVMNDSPCLLETHGLGLEVDKDGVG